MMRIVDATECFGSGDSVLGLPFMVPAEIAVESMGATARWGLLAVSRHCGESTGLTIQ